MKIKLIAPHERSETVISSAETFKFQRINLPLLAALTPPGHEVRIVDETFAPDDIDEEVYSRYQSCLLNHLRGPFIKSMPSNIRENFHDFTIILTRSTFVVFLGCFSYTTLFLFTR